MCGNYVCNVCAVPAGKSQEGYDKQNYQFGKCPNGACEQLKDKTKEKDLVTESMKRKGKMFGSSLMHRVYLDSSKKPCKFKSICDSSTVLSYTFGILE